MATKPSCWSCSAGLASSDADRSRQVPRSQGAAATVGYSNQAGLGWWREALVAFGPLGSCLASVGVFAAASPLPLVSSDLSTLALIIARARASDSETS